jgi:hypothetical protein
MRVSDHTHCWVCLLGMQGLTVQRQPQRQKPPTPQGAPPTARRTAYQEGVRHDLGGMR